MPSICMRAQTQNHHQFTNCNIMLLSAHQQTKNQQEEFVRLHYQQQATSKILCTNQLQNIQPNIGSGLEPILLPKKKYTYTNITYGDKIPSVARRNARERNRVKQVNNGFVNLRQHIPQAVINALSNGRGASKKLSKVDTLRIAVEYIRGLQNLLDDSKIKHRNCLHIEESSNDGSCAYSPIGSPISSASSTNQYQKKHLYRLEQSISPITSYSDCDINYMRHIKLEEEQQQQQFKMDSFDGFSDENPDDDELLDYISSWQEQ